jgi:type 1 glutamine amidotransferase
MDETESHWKETGAGCLAVVLLLAAAVIFARCTTPAVAEIEQKPTQPVQAVGYDLYTNTARALADLDAYLITVTTTSTISPKTAKNNSKTITQPSNPADHADKWDRLAQCETGGNWAANTGNGFGGGLQFMHQNTYSTWLSFGGGEYAAHPWEASREQQIAVAEKVLASSGFKAWPGCSRKFGWI